MPLFVPLESLGLALGVTTSLLEAGREGGRGGRGGEREGVKEKELERPIEWVSRQKDILHSVKEERQEGGGKGGETKNKGPSCYRILVPPRS